MLVADPNERLGHNGATEIMDHQYFEGIDWDKVAQKKLSMFKPQIPIIKKKKNQKQLNMKEFIDEEYACFINSSKNHLISEFDSIRERISLLRFDELYHKNSTVTDQIRQIYNLTSRKRVEQFDFMIQFWTELFKKKSDQCILDLIDRLAVYLILTLKINQPN